MFKKTAVEDYLQLHFYALTAPKKLVACFSSVCWVPFLRFWTPWCLKIVLSLFNNISCSIKKSLFRSLKSMMDRSNHVENFPKIQLKINF